MVRGVRNIMLKLVNIVKNDNIIEADYIPEHSDKKAHVVLNISTGEYDVESIKDYGSMYSRMAINGLQRTANELKENKSIPKERTVMWY